MPRNELQRRVVTGALIGAVIIGATLGGIITCGLLILVIAFGSSIEFFRIQSSFTGMQDQVVPTLLVVSPVIALAGWIVYTQEAPSTDQLDVLIAILLSASSLFFILQLRAEAEQIRNRLLVFGGAAIWISLPSLFAIFLCGITPWLLLGVFILIWSSDVFAYFGGKAFGKHKLAQAISPNKTWEGFISGLVATLVTAWIVSMWLNEIQVADWLVVGALVSVFGALGDLLQSVVKRAAGVKDAGRILPGHGGIWDRFDSFLGCIPLVGVYMLFF